MAVTDIILEDNTFKPKFKDGDLVVAESDPQHIDWLLRSLPGQWYQFPKIGINIKKFTLATVSTQEIEQAVREGLLSDNYNVKDVIITPEEDGLFRVTTNALRRK